MKFAILALSLSSLFLFKSKQSKKKKVYAVIVNQSKEPLYLWIVSDKINKLRLMKEIEFVDNGVVSTVKVNSLYVSDLYNYFYFEDDNYAIKL